MSTRSANEKRFTSWEDLEDGGRLYRRVLVGRNGWSAMYVKQTDKDENTVRFWQEIYDNQGVLTEIHHKFPIDTGHQKIEEA